MRDRFVQLTSVDGKEAKVIMGNIVIRSHGKSVIPKSFAVSPIRRLKQRTSTEGNDGGHGSDYEKPPRKRRPGGHVGNSPDDQKKQTNVWKIAIAVGMALFSDLNDPDDWH